MKNKTMRTFVVEEKVMQFNLTFFNNIFKNKADIEKKKIGVLEEELATVLFVEKSTVHAWRNRVNGPSDLDKVEQIAKYFDLEMKDFLIEVEDMFVNTIMGEEEKKMEKNAIDFSDREKDAIKRVYVEMIRYMRLRNKYDKEMYESVNDYLMIQASWDFLDETYLDEYCERFESIPEHITIFDHIKEVNEKWQDVEFKKELERVSEVLEDEMIDLPRIIYFVFEVFISKLEDTCWKETLDIGICTEKMEDDDVEEYVASVISEAEIKNEKIFSEIKENLTNMFLNNKEN